MKSIFNASPGGSPRSPNAARQQKSYTLSRGGAASGVKGGGGRKASCCLIVSLVLLLILLLIVCGSFVPDILGSMNSSSNIDSGNGDDDTTTSSSSSSSSAAVNVNVVTEVITVPVMLPHGVDIAHKGKSMKIAADSHGTNQAILATVRKLDMSDLSTTTKKHDRPVLITGWQDAQENAQKMHRFSKTMEYDNFVKTFGNYSMFVKDEFVQPLKDKQNRKCIAPASYKVKIMKSAEQNTLFFTNDVESPLFMRELTKLYTIPQPIDYKNGNSDGFHVFSAMVQGSYHGFHKHDEAQIYQVHGRKIWWFLPPKKKTRPKKVNPCKFLTGEEEIRNEFAISVVQQPGDTIVVPKGWWHATCALDDWTVAVGMQRGSPKQYEQDFEILPQPYVPGGERYLKKVAPGAKVMDMDERVHPMPWKNPLEFHMRMIDCGIKYNWNNLDSWGWFNGDVNKYYNTLISSDSKRDPNNIKTYAVHRWLGKERSTLVHYDLILSAMRQFTSAEGLRVLDAGCGLGAGLMWFERYGPPSFEMVGHTLSSAQLDFIHKLPSHKFRAELKSYDDLDAYGGDSNSALDAIYSIEAFIHSPDENNTLKQWSNALADKGIIVLIDDFLSIGVDENAEDIQVFKQSWMANVLQTTSSLTDIAERHNLELVLDRDIGSEYQVNKLNYRNKKPMHMMPEKGKSHQGWLGSKMRQRLMIEGKLTYRLVVFQKKGGVKSDNIEKRYVDGIVEVNKAKLSYGDEDGHCTAVQFLTKNDEPLEIEPIKSEHRTGRGSGGGGTQRCISGWYCCGMGEEWWNNLEENRTDNTSYLKLSKSLFGNYMDKIVENLNKFYKTLPQGTKGKFLDIGGTGSVASGMAKVTSKFAHFAGPFDYWVLDSDPAAAKLENAVYCDMANCPKAKSCEYDVTFSHTVLEHTPRPWEAFDTIARLTKKGGLTAHVVPFSYQYHATPDDNYRFSHKALISLMEDRGFTVLDVGYDICTKPEKVLREKVDEHFDTIWLTYVIAQKN